jgi:uncharacterized membrane protein YbhN (UPF0104 family)
LKSVQRKLFVAAQWLFAIAVVWFAVAALRGQWDAAALRLVSLSPDWTWIAASTAIVLGTYVLLIDTWREIVTGAGERLVFRDAARIWFVSNLGKYVPGKVWSIAAMTVLARRSDVAPAVAAGSSILTQLVTLAAGIAVVLLAGARTVDQPIAAALAGVGLIALLAAIPVLLPVAGRLATRVTGKTVRMPPLSSVSVWSATGRAVVAWVAYGIAFKLFTRGIAGSATGATLSYIAVFAASYIIGFLALFAPGGVVVRESAMIGGMVKLGLASHGDALAIAVASRLWLTVTELVPGFIYLVLGRRHSKTG